jgi:hypothetical protein
MEVRGKRVRGCPRRRWIEYINEDLIEKKLKRRDAVNRQRWKTNEKRRPYLK